MISYEFYSFGCCLYFPKQFPVVSQNETREKKNEKNKKLEINQKHPREFMNLILTVFVLTFWCSFFKLPHPF